MVVFRTFLGRLNDRAVEQNHYPGRVQRPLRVAAIKVNRIEPAATRVGSVFERDLVNVLNVFGPRLFFDPGLGDLNSLVNGEWHRLLSGFPGGLAVATRLGHAIIIYRLSMVVFDCHRIKIHVVGAADADTKQKNENRKGCSHSFTNFLLDGLHNSKFYIGFCLTQCLKGNSISISISIRRF
jgi:hypothetical protein